MIDLYHYLTNEEFLDKFEDRIPVDLFPRISNILSSDVSNEDYLLMREEVEEGYDRISSLEDQVIECERDCSRLEEEVGELKDYIRELEAKLEAKQQSFFNSEPIDVL